MADVRLVPADAQAVQWVAAHLRAVDLAEMQAVHGADVNPRRLLFLSAHVSDAPMVALAPDGEPIAVLGCAPVSLLDGVGSPWLLGTDRAGQYPRAFVALGRREVAGWSKRYAVLRNWADARNTRTLRWLARIGFDIHPAAPRGAMGLPFHQFTMVRVADAGPSNIEASTGESDACAHLLPL